jgi:single-stranded-DNA-specific exonuclease
MKPDPGGLYKEAEQASSILKDYSNKIVRVVTHNDADGLTAGGIIHKTLLRENWSIHTRSIKQLEEPVIRDLSKENPDVVIFTDCGSGQLDFIKDILLDNCLVIVVDHHQPKIIEHENLVHLNPHHHGIDGSKEISGSGMAYIFSRAYDPENIDLSALAIVGAIGDIQDGGGVFKGVNREIIKDGEKAGVLKVEKDLRLFGRQTRPLYKAIEYTTEPFIPGLSGSESASIQFLNDLGIPVKKDGDFTMLADLDKDEGQRLATALVLKMIENKVPPKLAEGIVGEVCTLLKEDKRTHLRDGREFATLLNGCGKHEKNGIGLAVCLGDRGELYKKSLDMLREHKGYLSKCYKWISKNTNRIKDMEVLYSLDVGEDINENVIGTVASMVLNSRMLEGVKPIIAFSKRDDEFLKVSSRGTRDMIENGLNLGKVMAYASEGVKGEGGGHDIAAGAIIKEEKKEKFLEYAREEIKRQWTATGHD